MSEDWSRGWEFHRGLDFAEAGWVWVAGLIGGLANQLDMGAVRLLWRRLAMGTRGAGGRVRQGAMAGPRLV